MILVGEVMISDLKVPVNSFLVVARVFPHLGGAEDLIATLSLRDTTSRIDFVNLMHHMRNVLICYTKCFTVELCIQVHLNSSFRILSIEIALFSLTEISSL
jgi:hypothetical protein